MKHMINVYIMPDISSEIMTGKTGGESSEVIMAPSLVDKIVGRTRRAVANVSLVLGVLAGPAGVSACNLPPLEQCGDLHSEERPLEGFFGRFDLRQVEPLEQSERLSLPTKEWGVKELSYAVSHRFGMLSKVQMNLDTLFDYSEETALLPGGKDEITLLFGGIKENLDDFEAELKTKDPEATVKRIDEDRVIFSLDGVEYNVEVRGQAGSEKKVYISFADRKLRWMVNNSSGVGFLFEREDTPDNDIYQRFFDKSGTFVQFRTDKPVQTPDSAEHVGDAINQGVATNNQDFSSSGLNANILEQGMETVKDSDEKWISRDGVEHSLNSIDDLYNLAKEMETVNVFMSHGLPMAQIIKILKGSNISALIKMISIFPDDDPSVFNALLERVYNDTLKSGCNLTEFPSPNEAFDRGLDSEDSLAMIYALWARLNGYKVTVYDVRQIIKDNGQMLEGAHYVVDARNLNTGKRWLMENQIMKEKDMKEDINLEKYFESNGSIIHKKIVDQVSF